MVNASRDGVLHRHERTQSSDVEQLHAPGPAPHRQYHVYFVRRRGRREGTCCKNAPPDQTGSAVLGWDQKADGHAAGGAGGRWNELGQETQKLVNTPTQATFSKERLQL